MLFEVTPLIYKSPVHPSFCRGGLIFEMNNKLVELFHVSKPIIGMVHLRPLPGSPGYNPVQMGMDKIIATAIEEAKTLEKAEVNGIQVENMWDIPYLRNDDIGYETVAALAVCIKEVKNEVSIPVGAECHMNGADCALACAIAAGASWIRVFEWCNAFISQSGFINAIGAKVSRMRHNLMAENILALCDINVKHGSHFIIHDRSVAEQAMDIEAQNGDTVIVTGFDTGMPPTIEDISKCKQATSLPILVGSGINIDNVNELLSVADGAIIGSWFKEENNWKNPVSYKRTSAFMNKVNEMKN
jgi:membrane complex biogenesis BtpA family protein